jgi:general stress protein 26
MEKAEFIAGLTTVITDVKTGLLATVDGKSMPHMRWMTPTLLEQRPGALYAVSSKNFAKREQLDENPRVQWLFQTRSLDTIYYVDGFINLIDNKSLLSEVLEVLAPRLRTFWNVNPDETSLFVLETVMESGRLFLPMKGTKRDIELGGE